MGQAQFSGGRPSPACNDRFNDRLDSIPAEGAELLLDLHAQLRARAKHMSLRPACCVESWMIRHVLPQVTGKSGRQDHRKLLVRRLNQRTAPQVLKPL
jgi:hypothetical protein